eukprot:TRINITY_DN187_c0_g1_i1.p1 TRINITY_DN187_c0_g1~~TRINITY_DN187_c0_g1_i1.p1  ORF type:complete len:448 (-),score=116.01 TRINITY_DN187_c0_g1_i1:110-1453(-)
MENLMNYFFTDADGYPNPFDELRGKEATQFRYDPAGLGFRANGDPNANGTFGGTLLFDETSTEGNHDLFGHFDTASVKLEEQSPSPFLGREFAVPLSHPHPMSFRHLPFHITRPTNATGEEERATPSFIEIDKMMSKSKRIIKREKAKTRKLTKEANPEIREAITAEMAEYEHLDKKAKKKMVQVIRNRISAQNSRDRKKLYVGNLEKVNVDLKNERNALLARIAELEAAVARTDKQETTTKTGIDSVIKGQSPRGGNNLALLSLITLVSLVALLSTPKKLHDVATKVLAGTLPLQSATFSVEEAERMLEKVREMEREFRTVKLEESQETYTMIPELSPSSNLGVEETNLPTTVFCPLGVLMEGGDGASDSIEKVTRRLEESEWLQLVIPTATLTTPSNPSSLQAHLPSSNSEGIHSKVAPKNTCDTSQNSLLQLICKVKSVRTMNS